jgi:hypothetical protein
MREPCCERLATGDWKPATRDHQASTFDERTIALVAPSPVTRRSRLVPKDAG